MRKKPPPTPERLRSLFAYDRGSGVLSWRSGGAAGRLRKDGYLWVQVDGTSELVHRIIWATETGSWPRWVDHDNLDRSDNRWSNLRDASPSQNLANTSVKKNNKLGIKGVHRLPNGSYRAHIHIDRKSRHLGLFSTPEQAKEAYDRAALAHWGGFARAA